jgi:effector-binding domain-containing protein
MKKHFIPTILFSALFLLTFNPLTLFAQEGGCTASGPVIEVKQVESQKTIVIRFDVSSKEIGPAMGEAFGKLFGFLGSNSIAPAGPPFSVYYSYDPAGNTVFEAGVPVSDTVSGNDEIRYKEFPAMKVVTTQFKGPYDAMEPTYGELYKYVSANGLESDGTAWEVYLTDPSQQNEPKENQTLIYMPVK